MSTRIRSSAAALVMAMFFAIPSLAADDETTKKDLMADNDHIATCKDGNRYHVFLNSAGRVVVEKQ